MKPLALLTAAVLLGSAAGATPLVVPELTDFASGPPTFVGTLDVGANIVSGHVDFATDPSGDFVSVDLPVGLRIVAISLQLSNFIGFGNDWARVSDETLAALLEQQFQGGNVATIFTSGLPAAAAHTYGFANLILPEHSADLGYDWTWSIAVEAASVPEPGSLLLGSTMLAVVRSRLRRARLGRA